MAVRWASNSRIGPFTERSFGSRYGAQTNSIYLQDQVELSASWQLLAGVRYDRGRLFYEDTVGGLENFPEQTQSRASPRLGIVFKPQAATALYASYSTSFRPQIFYSRPDGELPKPEIGKQIEVGWKQGWGRLDATLALFEIRKRNVSTSAPGDPLLIVQTGEQRSRGVELELLGRITESLLVNAGLAVLEATVTRDEDIPVGDWLANAPRRQANVWIKYTPQGELGWYVGGGVLYASEREANFPNNGVQLPEAARLDMVVGYNGQGWSAQINGRNLGDRKLYDSWGSFFIPQAGRSASAQVTFEW